MNENSVIVVGGGIAGLTAGALLANEGFNVTLIEAHSQPGGCAGTFRRGPFVFDVGATQVAGLEKGGIHERIFRHLNWRAPNASILDPACVVHLEDGQDPIYMWHDSEKWKQERKTKFPGSENFWSLCDQLHRSNWSFVGNDPILPAKNLWDFTQLLKAVRPTTLMNACFSRSSISDLLWICACDKDPRLRKFLDLQLKLYSQETSDNTAALYGATVLQMAQEPLGLWHLKGSMQKLSDNLLSCFLRDGGKLLTRHKVVALALNDEKKTWHVEAINKNSVSISFDSSDVIFTLPPQCLMRLISTKTVVPQKYRHRLEDLSQPSGAIVFYGAIKRSDLSSNCCGHIQLLEEKLGSLFISISFDGDGRAPLGQATVIASAFTNVDFWTACNDFEYKKSKVKVLHEILHALNLKLGVESHQWIHKEVATPKSFANWTGRPQGIVGGLGQRPETFGPFGLSSRTPMKGLWLCGDSIYPGEGTAGVSQSALMACRQLIAENGRELYLKE